MSGHTPPRTHTGAGQPGQLAGGLNIVRGGLRLEALAEAATAVDMVLVAAEAGTRLGLAGTSFPSQCPGRHQRYPASGSGECAWPSAVPA